VRKWGILLGVGALFGFGIVAKVKLGQQSDGSFVVSSGQRIELLGHVTRLEGVRPKDMALSPDKSVVALLTHQRLIVCDLNGKQLAAVKSAAGPLGVAWSPDGKTVYATIGTGRLGTFGWDGAELTKDKEIRVEPATAKGNPGTGGLAVGQDGTIYAALSIRNEVVALSPSGEIKTVWKTGACPYHLLLSPDGHTLAVANRGGTIVAPSPEQRDPTTRNSFEGTTIASANSAGTLVQIDPRTDAALVGTVSFINIASRTTDAISVAVGRQPSGMAFSSDGNQLYVADSDEDAVSIVDPAAGREVSRISVTPKEDPSFGQIPTSLALSTDGKLLYVALGGANAVAVVHLGTSPAVDGYFPTAWYPITIAATPTQVLIGCAKGIGSRPSNKTTGFYVHDSVGAYQAIDIADVHDLRRMTRRVARNNDWTSLPGPRANRNPVPVPERIGEPSVFKHVVYIIKENLAYDIAMGDMKEGNGDPSLCTFPENVDPNYHALARRYGLLDNFYISGTNSADGHQWVDSSIANGYTEQNYGANERSYPYDGGDPLAFSPAGFLWSQAKAAGKSVRIFGEFVDKPSIVDSRTGKTPGWKRCWDDYKSGKNEVEIRSHSSEAGVTELLDPYYIGFPLNVSDQWRADRFLTVFNGWEANNSMPELTIMLLPNNHTGGTRPGWPTPRAYVADNDYALGRIVEAISHSKDWAQTLIVVAEDDSQNGLDHVDGHRSICFCISPYSHQGESISDMYTHASIASTIEHVLGIQPMTRFDRTAKPMFGCFGDTADLTPYTVVPNRVPIDELNPPAKKAKTVVARQLALACAKMDWDDPDTQDQNVLNRAIWQSEAARTVGKHGYSTVYPAR
jgi:DNA-binding beta-propeller fold protein YncE